MTNKELHELVAQIGTHVSTLAQQQSIINKLLTEGIRQTGDQIQALLVVTQSHQERLDHIEGNV